VIVIIPRELEGLASRSILVLVNGIRVDEETRVVAVSVTADLAPLLPSLLQGGEVVTVSGYAQARLDGR
jgi:hypothetical protein